MKTKIISAIAIIGIILAIPIHSENLTGYFVWKVIVPPLQNGEVRTCPICGASLPESDIKSEGAILMKKQLVEGLKTMQGCKFLFFADAEDKTELEKISDPAQMLAAAKQKGATVLIAPVLLRYHELVGSKFAASSPAGVVFHLHIIRAEDSKTIWNFTYDETQRPLSENILEFNKLRKRGFKWVKAEQILAEGIQKAMKAFPVCGETPP